ncbi:hypothetical protein [Burkholderia ubonensis]|uniref:hypothetical protein n=1 Tax=Burkholderia ubonensis TaxID=101571 RepID=UPI0012F73D3D|nr:hypothetical protein [Burkholderia ubonensis]
MTRNVFRCAIKGLSQACAGYPQACQQKLWVNGAMRRVRLARHRQARIGRGAGGETIARGAPLPRARHASRMPKPAGSRAWRGDAQDIHKLANKICGQAGHRVGFRLVH